MKKIFCIGSAAIDYKLKPDRPLTLATSNPVSSFRSLGGVARNVAENLGKLTECVHLQCVVGNDHDGHQLLNSLKKLNVQTESSLILDDCATANYYAVLDQNGELHIALAELDIYNRMPCTSFVERWNWPKDSIVFIETNLSAAIIREAINKCQSEQLKLCIDPVSVFKSKNIPYSLEGIFLIKPNQLQAEALTGIKLNSTSDCIVAGKMLLDRGAAQCIITLGDAGYVIVNDEIQKHFASHRAQIVVDVTGAGDAFSAGILFGLQQNFAIEKSCEIGAKLAALTVQSEQTVIPNINHDALGIKYAVTY